MRDILTGAIAVVLATILIGISGEVTGPKGNPAIEMRVLRAKKYLELGQPTEALLELEKLTQEGVADPQIWQARCETLLRLKRATEAERVARHWIEVAPQDGRAHFFLGVTLVDKGLQEEGIRELGQSVKWGGEHADKAIHLLADLHMERGLGDRDAGRWAEARASMELATKLDPSNASFHKALGQVYNQLELWPEALDEFDQAMASGLSSDAEMDLHDDMAAVHQHLAAVFLCREDYGRAQDHAQAGLSHTTTRSAVRRFKGLARTAKRLETEVLRIKARQDPSLWPCILARVPQDPEAQWELLSEVPIQERLSREREILESSWGGEARVRLADRLWVSHPEESFQIATEALGRLPLERALEWEEHLFEKVVQLQEPPRIFPWDKVWHWKKAQNKDQWEQLRLEIENHLNERYYVWIYCGEYFLDNALPVTQVEIWIKDIESLDPPPRARSKIDALKQRVKSMSP